MEYLPRKKRNGMKMPFGYYVNPVDKDIWLPDKEKLDALHYAFRMKSKYKTPLRDCTQWLQLVTDCRMSPSGFLHAYNRWDAKLRKERRKQIDIKKRELLIKHAKFIEDNFGGIKVVMDDGQDIAALAEEEGAKELKEERRKTRRDSKP